MSQLFNALLVDSLAGLSLELLRERVIGQVTGSVIRISYLIDRTILS